MDSKSDGAASTKVVVVGAGFTTAGMVGGGGFWIAHGVQGAKTKKEIVSFSGNGGAIFKHYLS
jgi:hypothetical protein